MTNSALKAMIEEFGNRINIIVLDNDVRIYIGYPSSPLKDVNDIILKTFGDIDMIGIPKAVGNPKAQRNGVTTTIWHPTACIQLIATVDEDHPNYLIDPMTIG